MSVISVVMKARSRRYPINTPLTAPSSAPTDKRGGDHGGHRPGEHVEQVERTEVGEREHRSDRKVDAADDDDQRHAQRDEADFSGLARGIREARRRQEMVDGAAQRETDGQKENDRNGRLGPALGQDLAEEMVRPIAVSQPNQGIAHQRSVDSTKRKQAKRVPGGEPGTRIRETITS